MEQKFTPEFSEETNTDTVAAVVENIDAALKSPEAEDQFIKQRLKELEQTADQGGVSVLKNRHRGFILSEAVIKPMMLLDGYKLNDTELYTEFFRNIKTFKNSPGWGEKPTRKILLPAIQYTLGQYFGNHIGDDYTEYENHKFHEDRTSFESEPADLHELKGKNFAVCIEKSPAAQNLLAFMGADSEVIVSECEIQPGHKEMHVFNILLTVDNRFIYDPTNPQQVYDKRKKQHSYLPALYKITEEQYQDLSVGKNISVEHEDYQINGEEKDVLKSTRIYAAPVKWS